MTSVAMREAPDGMTYDYNESIWNVGHVYTWSNVFEGWLWTQIRLSIKPYENLTEAYQRETGQSLPLNTTIFFVKE